MVEQILRLRREWEPDHGAGTIRAVLVGVAGEQGWAGRGLRVPGRAGPRSTGSWTGMGLLAKNPAKRPRRSWRRFGYARPQDCYQIDGTEYGWPTARRWWPSTWSTTARGCGWPTISPHQRIRIARRHAAQTVTLLRNGSILPAHTSDGDLIGHLTLNETKHYQAKPTPAA